VISMRASLPLLLASLFLTGVSRADVVRTVDGSRLTLGQLVDDVPVELAAADVGAAPPPGATRIVTREDLEQRCSEQGISTAKLKFPHAVRVLRASKRLTPGDVSSVAEAAVRQVLPPGVDFVKIETGSEVVLSPRDHVESVEVGRFPHRTGVQRASGVVVFGDGEGRAVRLPVTVVATVADAAARPDVPRNGRVSLVVQRGAMRVAADGAALSDASVGDVVAVRVSATGRVVRARLTSRDEAELMESP